MLNQYRRAAESLDSKVSSNNIQSFNLHNTALWLSIDPVSEDLSVKGCVPEIPASNDWFKNTVHIALFIYLNMEISWHIYGWNFVEKKLKFKKKKR